MVTRIEISEKCDIPGIEDPSSIEFQVKRMINRTTNTHIVSGLKDAYRRLRMKPNGKLEEKTVVHSSITDAMKGKSDKNYEWIENDMSFEALLVCETDKHFCKYLISGVDGTVKSVDLVSKELKNEEDVFSKYHDSISGYLE